MDKAREAIGNILYDHQKYNDGHVGDTADAILAALPEIIKGMVKPLEWEHVDGNYPKWISRYYPVWGGMFQARIDKSKPRSFGRFPLFINGVWDGKKHQTLKSAMASAQNNYHNRATNILKALGMGEGE